MKEELPSILISDGWVTGENDNLTEVVIPSTVDTYQAPTKVTFLGDTLNWIPSTAAALQEFVAPNVTAINAFLFSDYTKLTSAIFPSVTAISAPKGTSGTFKGCTGLTAINMPSLVSIDESITGSGNDNKGTFYGCSALSTLNMPSLVSIILGSPNGGTFLNCTSLTEVTLPSLETISLNTGYGRVFGGCTSLTTVTFPKIKTIASTSMNSGTFYNCTSLTSVQLGSDGNPVTSLGDYTFHNCTQSGLTITVYTADGNAISGSPWGATNATIVYKTA